MSKWHNCLCKHDCSTQIAVNGFDSLGRGSKVRIQIRSRRDGAEMHVWLEQAQVASFKRELDAMMASPEGVAP